MATKTISTRIKNKVDNYSTWASSSNNLLNGEIAIVRVPTGESYINPVTGKSEPVVELLMKVGDGTSSFANLPWLSAKASDVYNWAKGATAEDVKIKIKKGSDSTATESTLGAWLKTAYDAGTANASNISKNTSAITTLNGSDTTAGSVAKAIKDAIAALDANAVTGSGNFVKAVAQTDGKITVTKGNIAESDLPNISAGKITVDTSNTTLSTKLGNIDADITSLKAKNNGHTDTEINSMIDSKINALDSTTSGSGSYVTNVTQTNGIVTVTKGNLPAASTSKAGIAKLGVSGGAATYDSVNTLSADVTALKETVKGGVHFRGIVSATPSSATVTIDNKSYTAVAGDIVLFSGKEFIYTGSAWEELGDLSRVGTLETWRNNLKKADTAVASQFVTEVDIADNGTVTINRAQPTSTDIKHGSASTVSAAISAIDAKLDGVTKVTTSISDAINALDSTTSGSGSYVTNVTQTNGKVTVTKGNLPTASTSTAGIAKLGVSGGAATYDAVNTINTTTVPAVSAIESNYVRFTNNKLYVGKDGADEIIFDCGGAE